MKEATGELNATVFVVIAVASLVAFFYTTIWPSIKGNLNENISCSRAICESTPNADGNVDCHLVENGEVSDTFTCAWKG